MRDTPNEGTVFSTYTFRDEDYSVNVVQRMLTDLKNGIEHSVQAHLSHKVYSVHYINLIPNTTL